MRNLSPKAFVRASTKECIRFLRPLARPEIERVGDSRAVPTRISEQANDDVASLEKDVSARRIFNALDLLPQVSVWITVSTAQTRRLR